MTLQEPRILYNISVCYLAKDETSRSDSYRESLKTMLNYYAQNLAQATDGHVLINKIILFSTDRLMNFFDTNHKAAMADVHIQSLVKDEGTWFQKEEDDGDRVSVFWQNTTVWSNAHLKGFYSAKLVDNTKELEMIFHLSNVNLYRNLSTYKRIQMGGEIQWWNLNFIQHLNAYSETLTHESGHYLLQFYDEYGHWKSATEKEVINWNNKNRPYDNFGLMDNEHDDIEISNSAVDYAGLSFLKSPTATNSTAQYYAMKIMVPVRIH